VTGPLLTAREVADLLGVSSETVLRWTRKGELPAIKLPGGAIRFREDALEAWLAERACGAHTAPDSKAGPRGAVTPTRALTKGDVSSSG
jgi:excisionase family DNA binding protein